VALLPLLAVVAGAVLSVFAAGAASEAADAAAHSAAVALLQGRDPAAAARASLEAWPKRRTAVTVRGDRVTVTVRPAVPLLAKALEARTVADVVAAAPRVAPAPARDPRGGDGRSARPVRGDRR
jgi:hypothetical protein